VADGFYLIFSLAKDVHDLSISVDSMARANERETQTRRLEPHPAKLKQKVMPSKSKEWIIFWGQSSLIRGQAFDGKPISHVVFTLGHRHHHNDQYIVLHAIDETPTLFSQLNFVAAPQAAM
jgi:hypothetical protein